jgi:prevent-host-death family protein
MSKALHREPAREVGVRELRERLSHYLTEVAGGASIIVTDRGRPVARLSPTGDALEHYDRLVEDGVAFGRPTARSRI